MCVVAAGGIPTATVDRGVERLRSLIFPPPSLTGRQTHPPCGLASKEALHAANIGMLNRRVTEFQFTPASSPLSLPAVDGSTLCVDMAPFFKPCGHGSITSAGIANRRLGLFRFFSQWQETA